MHDPDDHRAVPPCSHTASSPSWRVEAPGPRRWARVAPRRDGASSDRSPRPGSWQPVRAAALASLVEMEERSASLSNRRPSTAFANWRHDHSSSKVQSGSARPTIEDAASGPK
jgi:hypothetical protein